MTDEDAIRALQQAYADRFDARDAEGFANLYTEDAVLTLPDSKEIVGRNKIIKAVRNMPPGGKHIPGAAQIKVDGNTARGTNRYRAIMTNGTEVTGTYEDEYRRTPEGWRFSRRKIVMDQ